MTVLTEIGFKTRDEKEERGFFVLKLMLVAAVGGLFQLGLAEEGRGVPAADRTRSVCLEPLVDTLAVELVAARQNSNHLALLKVAHADDADSLLAILAAGLARVPVAGQLLDVTLGEPLRLDLAQALGEGEKRLVVLGLGHVGSSQLGMESGVTQHRQHVQQEAGRIGLMQRCLAEG